ncbi:hypothetical protein [Hymenobacter negativus]|uniref:Uncharacterized protein n=1 Tax=Hymenobacter negativus TaxID=2795026 RepID=A0ABS0QCA4_9BACT|nr:hypothetical protein [Hymenobacter negativus]MBH8559856.1 hypothetical protein [Hymenobacter negativus]
MIAPAPGFAPASAPAREGCLRYVGALGVLSAAALDELRRQLLITSPRAVADAYWEAYWADEARHPLPAREELCYTLERLAEEPGYFAGLED